MDFRMLGAFEVVDRVRDQLGAHVIGDGPADYPFPRRDGTVKRSARGRCDVRRC